jgi:hypothetical protein
MVRLITLAAGSICLGAGIAFAIEGNDLWLIFVALGVLVVVGAVAMLVAPRRGILTAYTDEDPTVHRAHRPPPGGRQ